MRHRIPPSRVFQRNDFFDASDDDFKRGFNKAVANNWITIDCATSNDPTNFYGLAKFVGWPN
jgi:hypothetical protein